MLLLISLNEHGKSPLVLKTAGFFAGGQAYLRFLAGVPPRALGSLLPPRGAGALLVLALLLVAAATLLPPRGLRAELSLLSARALRAARLGR